MKNPLKKYSRMIENCAKIVDYFSENPGEIYKNALRLEDIRVELMKPLPVKIDVSDKDIYEKAGVICKLREVENTLDKLVRKKIKDRFSLTKLVDIKELNEASVN